MSSPSHRISGDRHWSIYSEDFEMVRTAFDEAGLVERLAVADPGSWALLDS